MLNYVKRYEPVTLFNEMNRFIEQAFNPMRSSDVSNIETSQWVPTVDIKENKNNFVIFADLPGIDKEDVNISMENNILTINGCRREDTKEEMDNYFRLERQRGTFYRRFTLPNTADGSKIEAKIQKGVLQIIIPKKETAQPKLIKITDDD